MKISPAALTRARAALDPDWWAEREFYIPETNAPIQLALHQRAFLRYVFRRPTLTDGFQYTTVLYSAVKKSGKTAIAGLVARWAAETWGPMGEIYCLANDFEQAAGRIYSAARQSIELSPGYDGKRRELPGRWRVREREMFSMENGATIKALAGDYKGEAGANPSLTLWSELWGYELERARRLWDEMTPPPTRQIAMRWVETYAGFEGESELLYELYEMATKGGVQLQVQDLDRAGVHDADRAFEEAPRSTDRVPIYVNDKARLVALWDDGEQARRMPWLCGEAGAAYYDEQVRTLRPSAYRRFHLNEWVSAESAFVERSAWDACAGKLPAHPDRAGVVVGIDAAVSGDCMALVVCARHPQQPEEVVVRQCMIWPAGADKFDYDRTLTPALEAVAARFNVVMVAYDPYQLHLWATQQRKAKRLRFFEFSQGERRLRADKQLADLITQCRLHHAGDDELTAHVMNAAAKEDPEGHKLRIVKKSASRYIDAAVALSMAAYECLRLRL